MKTNTALAIAAFYYPNPEPSAEGSESASGGSGGEGAAHRLVRMMAR